MINNMKSLITLKQSNDENCPLGSAKENLSIGISHTVTSGRTSREYKLVRDDEFCEKKASIDIDQLIGNFTKLNFEFDKWALMVKQAMSSERTERLEGTRAFRYMLSVSGEIPIQAVIETGIVPCLVEYMGIDDIELQFEAAWALTNIASGTNQQTEVVVQCGGLVMFAKLINSENEGLREQGMWGLGNIAGDRPEFRDAILQKIDSVHMFISAMRRSNRTSTIRTGVWAISNLCRGKPRPQIHLIKMAIPFLSEIIGKYKGDIDIAADSCWALDGCTDCQNGIQPVIDSGCIKSLVLLLEQENSNAVRPALRVIGQIATGTVDQTHSLIVNNVLPILLNLLSHPKKNIRKDSCWTLSNIAAGSYVQVDCLIECKAFDALAALYVQEAESDVRSEAAWAICNGITTGSNEQVIKYLKPNIILPVADMLTAEDDKIISVSLEAVNKILTIGKAICDYYPQYNSNIMMHILNEFDVPSKMKVILQDWPDQSLHEKIMYIMTNYQLGI